MLKFFAVVGFVLMLCTPVIIVGCMVYQAVKNYHNKY